MAERPKILSIDNRRDRSRPFVKSAPLLTTNFLNPQHITDITPKDITGSDLITIRGGDGTTGCVLNVLNQIDEDPVIFLEGGGSANTLLKGLRTTPQATIPQDFVGSFPPDSFEAHLYRPPQVTSYQGQETFAYLVAPDHLTVDVTKTREWISAHNLNKNMHLTYVISGLMSLFKLHGRVEPKDVVPSPGIDQQKIAAAAAIAVPILGTFKLLQPIELDKLRLLSIAAHTEYGLFFKYLCILLIGSSLPHGADTVIKLGLMDSQDIDKVSVTPDPKKFPNVCIDGELRTLCGRIEVARSPKDRLIIVPKY